MGQTMDQMKLINELRKTQKSLKNEIVEVEAGDGAVVIQITGELKIKKVSQTITLGSDTITAKANNKKAQKYTLKAKAEGAVSYKLVLTQAKIKMNSKGVITIPKNTKAGTYNLRIKMTAKETKNYKKTSVTQYLKVIL